MTLPVHPHFNIMTSIVPCYRQGRRYRALSSLETVMDNGSNTSVSVEPRATQDRYSLIALPIISSRESREIGEPSRLPCLSAN
ncbi:hypothetical protein, partial [Sphingobium sp. D43FB]|uniref:hypothetical protein n=1 Tax=Sphingobium sp. D43FB TaxID=2017595 RepID=UPI001C3EFCC6